MKIYRVTVRVERPLDREMNSLSVQYCGDCQYSAAIAFHKSQPHDEMVSNQEVIRTTTIDVSEITDDIADMEFSDANTK